MICCKGGVTDYLQVEADVGADPIWCNYCGCNLELEELLVSNDLKEELTSWAKKYGRWIDWENDQLLPNGMDMEAEFNQIGCILTEKLKKELEGNYKIKYKPSTSARLYNS